VEPLALPIRARFVPFPGHPACSSDWYMPRIPGGRFLRRPAAPGGRLILFVPAAEAGSRISPRHPIKAAPRRWSRARRPPSGGTPGHGAVASDTARVWTLPERRQHVARVSVSPRRD
jgi:hypothetical protein